MLGNRIPDQFRQILEKYRHDLLSKNKDGEWLRNAGPVTFGQRLDSPIFPTDTTKSATNAAPGCFTCSVHVA